MNKILMLTLAGVIFISGCIGENGINGTEVLTPTDVLENSPELIGEIISVKGTARIDWNRVGCTGMACTPEDPCCNSCEGPLVLHYGNNNISLSDVVNIVDYYCSGNECTMTCEPLEEGKDYVVTGLWNGNFLNMNSFREVESE